MAYALGCISKIDTKSITLKALIIKKCIGKKIGILSNVLIPNILTLKYFVFVVFFEKVYPM